ncbi:MAG: Rod shape-determining protein MreD [Bacteroidota bacterium]|nr:Rod shape-determining protein MreD [Bacteroidota bacterium]
MNVSDIVKRLSVFFVYVVLHVLWFKHFVFLDVALCFVYLGFLLTLPMDVSLPVLLLAGFFTGFSVDLFYGTMGVHTAASVAIMYFRPGIIRILTPLGGYNQVDEISINALGLPWFISFILAASFIHTSLVLMIETASFAFFYWTLLKIVATTLFTSFMLVSIEYLLFSKV